jgi:uncharacterized protein YjiS (DUF1127 family)
MTALPITCPVPDETRSLTRAPLAIARVLVQAVAAIAHELRARRDMRQLAQLNDHMLRDIGIVRADIEGAVRRGRDKP